MVRRSFKATPYRKRARKARPSFASRRNLNVRTSGYIGRFTGAQREMKFFDTSLSFAIDATGEVPATGQLNLIPQGVTESQRIGRKAVIKSIQLRARMSTDPVAGNLAALTYVLVVLDKQANGAAAAVTDVLTGNDLSTAMVNMANSERFTILKRIKNVWNFTAGVDGAYAPKKQNLEYYKQCNIPVEFSSTTGAIGEIKSNNIFLLAGTSTGTDDITQVTGTCRLRYVD